jgi:hypothetical protein
MAKSRRRRRSRTGVVNSGAETGEMTVDRTDICSAFGRREAMGRGVAG